MWDLKFWQRWFEEPVSMRISATIHKYVSKFYFIVVTSPLWSRRVVLTSLETTINTIVHVETSQKTLNCRMHWMKNIFASVYESNHFRIFAFLWTDIRLKTNHATVIIFLTGIILLRIYVTVVKDVIPLCLAQCFRRFRGTCSPDSRYILIHRRLWKQVFIKLR